MLFQPLAIILRCQTRRRKASFFVPAIDSRPIDAPTLMLGYRIPFTDDVIESSSIFARFFNAILTRTKFGDPYISAISNERCIQQLE